MDTDKKILVIISSWPSHQHPYITFLMDGLKNKFPNLQLFSFKVGNLESGYSLLGQERCDRLYKSQLFRFIFSWNPSNYIKPLSAILGNLKTSIYLYRICRREKYHVHQAIGQLIYNYQLLGKSYDLVYINALQSARHFCLRGLFPDIPIVASSRGQDFDFDPQGYDKVLQQLNHLHVLGHYLQQKAIDRGFPKERITIIPPAALPVQAHIKGETSEREKKSEIVITSASRLFWMKGYVYALRAIRRVVMMLPSHNIRYEIIGEGPDREFLQVEVHRLGLEKIVHFLGWLSQDEVNKRVKASDIYLLLSITEGFNNSVLQAQNLGVPCVVSDAGGLPENVIDQITGFVVPRYNAEAASDAITTLILDSTRREMMKNNGKRIVATQRSLAIQVNDYQELFEYLLNE